MPITAALLRTIDWSKTPLGPIDRWPRSLHAYVSLILDLPTPAIVFWGPEQTQIYNDGYAVIMGPRHPRYLGGSYRECWPDTYPLLIGEMRRVLDDGACFEVARAPIAVTRHGFTEEAFFTFTFSPLRDDDGRIAGIYQPVVEATDAVLRERRAAAVRALGARGDVLSTATEVMAANANDVPLAGIFRWNEAQGRLRIAAASGFATPADAEAALAPIAADLERVHRENQPVEVQIALPPAPPWPEPIDRLYLAPARRSPGSEPIAVVAFATSPRLRFDQRYREFLDAVAREIGVNLAAERAERARVSLEQREATVRREAAIAKDAEARRLAQIFAHAPVGIAVMRGPAHVYEVANPHYAALLPQRPLLGLSVRQALPELGGQGIFELLDGVYRTGIPYVGRSVGLLLARADGGTEQRYFDFVYQPMRDENDRVEGVIVVCFDITDLARARLEADAANRAKDEFFAILGHELRNPLAPITTALEVMRLRGDDAHAKERTILERQVGHITALVDDLLDVSRITRGKVALAREAVELAVVVARGVETASPLLEQRNHRLEIDVPESGLVVTGDPVRLAQVVANLLTNAAKYTEPGGTVRIHATTDGDRASLSVTDTGIGLSPETLAHIFEPFVQEHQALDRAQGGLGLGLTIVANLAKLHGGSVRASSPGLGRGSTFTVELPLADGPPSLGATRRANAAARSGKRLRVLIVDDNEDAAELLALTLGMRGWETHVAHDGPEALAIVDAFRPDVGLLDIGLPAMDGYELAQRLRQTARGAELRLVAVTGYGQESDRARARAAGFDAHLVKPVPTQTVAELVEQLTGPTDE